MLISVQAALRHVITSSVLFDLEVGSSFGPHPHRTRTSNASKWNLLMQMGVFTQQANNIKGFGFEFARAHPLWIGPYAKVGGGVTYCLQPQGGRRQ